MIVLLDLEWIEDGWKRLTQLSALRTDETWTPVSRLEVFAYPGDAALLHSEHMAFGGLGTELYRNAVSEEDCLLSFREWLEPEDTIWVWAKSNMAYLKELWLHHFMGTLPPEIRCLAQPTRKLMGRATREAADTHALLQQLGETPPAPAHNASNDVEAMRALFCRLGMSPAQLNEPPARPQPKQRSQRERNQRTIEKSQYRYLYLKGSPVFHRRGCGICLNARSEGDILGSVYYETAAKAHRPCKLCRPVPPLPPAPPASPAPPQPEAEENRQREIIRARMLTGELLEIRRGKIVGWCHNHLHKGAVNRSLLEEHDCLGKQCPFLEKNRESPFWEAMEAERLAKEARKAKLREKKAKKALEEEDLRSLADTWQSYLDDMGSDMQIVRIQRNDAWSYKVFYVSDQSYPDWHRYAEFLELLRFVHPHSFICLWHIQNLDGHCVTRAEYAARRR